eukprot:CAMPEP_0169135692 /NCGR_PEP_ID=MMETSP1015-20121227/40581_1 /TAXON_ID=342587 /ORGANISM="Karlodinium micrum, Strain CCMP2283" /LENGTH=1416 /DNA_ID=CAMNT_0009200367 /DNA_START=58 /DNA_END=4309 /DNA_ORIENTATION=+
MVAVHELLCRRKFADEQLHQLVHLCMSVFFYADVDFRLCAAAEEVLVTLFCRHGGMSNSIIQEFLVGVTKLPTGKTAKRFQLQVPQDNADHGLSTWTHLLLRLIQSTCLPLREQLGGKIEFDTVSQCRSGAQAALLQLTSGLVQRLLLTRARDDDLRTIFNDLIEELLMASLKPSWPGALAMLRTIFYQLVSLVQQGKRKELADASLREFCLKIISKVICHFSHHQVEAADQAIKLPPWTQASDKANKEYRVLQNVALRVSLQDGRKLPWTAAAKAVQAWDAEVHLNKDDDGSGLTNLTDDIVFRYLIMAHLEDERLVPAKCPPDAQRVTLASTVFQAAHPLHAWSFLVCDWAEGALRLKKQVESKEEEEGEVDLEAKNRQAVLERFLALSWTSPTILSGEGGSSRAGGRRVLLPYMVHKVFRQLQCGSAIDSLLKTGVDCLVMQANSPQATLRKTAVKSIGGVIEVDRRVLAQKAVEETLDMRIRDESAWVRQAALDLLGRLLDASENEENEDAPLILSQEDGENSALLQDFNKLFGHADVVPVAIDLLHRSRDSEKLRAMVIHTFELLWFADEEPSSTAVLQFARVMDASNNLSDGASTILNELLLRLKKNLDSKKRSRGYQHAMRRWMSLLLNEFVHLHGDTGSAIIKQRSKEIGGEEERWLRRRALLSTLEAFALAQPTEMVRQIRPLTVYLNLDDKSTAEEQWVAQRVCRILIAVLPCPVEKRGLFEHITVQNDLQALIKSQPSSGVREAARCLSLVVKHVTGDLSQVVKHIVDAIPAITHYCDDDVKPADLDRLTLLYISRLIWVTCSILETLPIDNYMEPQGNRLKREAFPFQLTDGSVASTVLAALSKMFAIPDNGVKAVVVQCLGFFLCGHRSKIKERTVAQMLAYSLRHDDMSIRLRGLETLSCLLSHFAKEAEKETAAGKSTTVGSVSAVDSAQPLAVHSAVVLSHITVDKAEIGKLIVHRASGSVEEEVSKIRIEALTVMRYLHQQGLVNPMTILPKVFALAFSVEAPLAEPAGSILKEMLELRPSILLNRLDEAFHDVFLTALASSQPPCLGQAFQTPCAVFCELYAEIFRKQKGTRESLLRKMLQQVLRLQATHRFTDLFKDLLECSQHPGMSKKRRLAATPSDVDQGIFDSGIVKQLPPLQYYQLAYAQFMSSIVTALPFQYESEPLLVIYECNRHLSLNGGVLSNVGDGMADEISPEASSEQGKDHFAEAVSIVTCLVLKGAMKGEYGLSSEQCVQFNPKEVKQEKLKGGWYERLKAANEDAPQAPQTSRAPFFPAEEWSRLASPLAAKYSHPTELAKLVADAIDKDPWDSNFSRYKAKVDQLEGRSTKPKPWYLKVKEKQDEKDVAQTPRGRAGSASAKRGRGRGRGAKRRKMSVAAGKNDDEDIQSIDDSEADSDYVP